MFFHARFGSQDSSSKTTSAGVENENGISSIAEIERRPGEGGTEVTEWVHCSRRSYTHADWERSEDYFSADGVGLRAAIAKTTILTDHIAYRHRLLEHKIMIGAGQGGGGTWHY